MVSSTVVPAGALTSGPGTTVGPDVSPSARTSRPGRESPWGYQSVRRASSWSVSTPCASDPAGLVLAFATATAVAPGPDAGTRPTDNHSDKPSVLALRIEWCCEGFLSYVARQ